MRGEEKAGNTGWGNEAFPASIFGSWCETLCLLNPGPLSNALEFTQLDSTERFAAFVPVALLGDLYFASWDFAEKGQEGCEVAATPHVKSVFQIASRNMGILNKTRKTSSP